MTRRTHRPIAAVTTMFCIALLALGCSDVSSVDTGSVDETDAGSATTTSNASTTTEQAAPEPTAGIMAAAAYQLVTVDHTFESGLRPFSTFLVQDRTDPANGSDSGSVSGNARPLTGGERSAIENQLSSLGEVLWIDDPAEYRTSDLTPTIEGGVIIGLGEPTIDGNAALAPVSLWCGGLCGTSFTYSLARDAAGEWAINGIDGPVAVS